MPIKERPRYLTDKQKEGVFHHLKECEALKEEIDIAVKAGIPGVELLQDKLKNCTALFEGIHQNYCRDNG